MRNHQEDTSAFNTDIKSAKFSHSTKVLSGPLTLTLNGPIVNFLNPNGSDRTITLPPFDKGRFFEVINIGSANNLVVVNAVGTTVVILLPGERGFFASGESVWTGAKASATTSDVFTNTKNGLVPAPNTLTPGTLFLRDDGQWATTSIFLTDAFKFVTDGTNTAIGTGADTLWLRSSTNKVGITVTNNQATYADNVNFTVNEAAVDHNALLNYVADQHVAHSSVTLTAGVGLSGGGTLAASRTFDLDLSDLTSLAPVLADSFAFYSVSAAGTRKATLTTLNGVLDHNALLNYSASRHIDHAGVSIVAGNGLTGGGTIETSRQIDLNVNGLSADTLATGDFFLFYDISGADHNKVTLANLNASLDHSALLNYVADQHVAHSSVSITAGAGLTGGGTITASRTLALDINGLSAAAAVSDTDSQPIYQGGNPLKVTYAQQKTWIKSWIVKGDVGLGNVDNTSDVTKQAATITAILNATQTWLGINTFSSGALRGRDLVLNGSTTGNMVLRAQASAGAGGDVFIPNVPTTLIGTDNTAVVTGKDFSSGNTFPTFNQNTTGSAAKLTTARTIDGQSFDGTTNITVIAPGTVAATAKTTPVDADVIPLADSAASNVLKKLSWSNIKATMKTYTDTLYRAVGTLISLTADVTGVLPVANGGTGGTSAWTDMAFNAGDYTTGSTMTWTVASGDLINYSYNLQGKILHIIFNVASTTVGGTANTELRVALPAGLTVAKRSVNAAGLVIDGAAGRPAARFDAAVGNSWFGIYRNDGANWALSTDATSILGEIVIAVA